MKAVVFYVVDGHDRGRPSACNDGFQVGRWHLVGRSPRENPGFMLSV